MTATIRVALAAFALAAGVVTAAGANASAPSTAPPSAHTNASSVADVRLAGFDQVLADNGCDGGSLQGSYYCYQQGGTPSPAPQPEYTPVQPPFGFNNLPQCSGGPLAAIAGVISGDGCT